MLEQLGEVIATDVDRPMLLATVGRVDVLWVRLRHRIDAEVFNAAPTLRIVASPTTGLDHIDLDEAARRGIQVLSLRGEHEFLKDVRATAELTIGLMLALLRRIPAATRDVEAGHWNRDAFKGNEIRGKTIGIVGYGRLGKLVARYLAAFGANLVASDPNVGSNDDQVQMLPLQELLRLADIVTVHVSFSDDTRGLIDIHALSSMKPGALLINTSRGALIDSNALLSSLADGHLGGAALDVLTGESALGVAHLPLVEYARDHDNLLITPHIGGCTHESMEATETFLAERLCVALSVK
jgi:D-3-phosphoglycerate dehydrogenase